MADSSKQHDCRPGALRQAGICAHVAQAEQGYGLHEPLVMAQYNGEAIPALTAQQAGEWSGGDGNSAPE